MIQSLQSMFSNQQAITATARSANVYNLGATGTPAGTSTALNRDEGKGHKIPIIIQVTETFATLTSLKVAVQVDDNAAFTSATTVLETEAIAAATLVAGYQFNIDALPLKTNEQYLSLLYTVAGSNATAGKISAWIAFKGNGQTAPL
jgi:hypothetical protein